MERTSIEAWSAAGVWDARGLRDVLAVMAACGVGEDAVERELAGAHGGVRWIEDGFELCEWVEGKVGPERGRALVDAAFGAGTWDDWYGRAVDDAGEAVC